MRMCRGMRDFRSSFAPSRTQLTEASMASDTRRHQHRHFKTLILLVITMTVGTFFLFWADKLSPGQNRQILRALAAPRWTGISVRAVNPGTDAGFCHFRIDEAGRLYQTRAWREEREDPRSAGTIRVVLTRPGVNSAATPAQAGTLRQVIHELRGKYSIAENRIRSVRDRDRPRSAARPNRELRTAYIP